MLFYGNLRHKRSVVQYTPMEPKSLTNTYVRDYYNAQVGALVSYTNDRWHSSPVREFEYRQTVRALQKALSGRTFTNAVEIGPGDGVFTPHIRSHVAGRLYLIEQSHEMLVRAKQNLSSMTDIEYEEGDFLTSNPPKDNELVIAVRCFEYFEDKVRALKKMHGLLASNGRLVIITKNSEMVTTKSAQTKQLHSDQVSRKQMQKMAKDASFTLTHTYPAVLRMKATSFPLRIVFDLLHRLSVALRMELPFATYATESYVYEFRPTA